jgi:hypothetical protein
VTCQATTRLELKQLGNLASGNSFFHEQRSTNHRYLEKSLWDLLSVCLHSSGIRSSLVQGASSKAVSLCSVIMWRLSVYPMTFLHDASDSRQHHHFLALRWISFSMSSIREVCGRFREVDRNASSIMNSTTNSYLHVISSDSSNYCPARLTISSGTILR